MTLQELRYLVAVARERHFGRAAEKCFVSQPSLSVAIKHLEEELDVAVFERTRNEVVVTEVGQQIVAQAARVLEEAAKVKQMAAAGKDQLAGALRFGVIHTIAPYILPDLVAALRVRARQMPLDIEENQTDHLDRMLIEGAIDVALLALPFEAPGVETTPVYDEDFEIIVPAKHPWARRKQVSADELEQENLLLLSMGHCLRDQVLAACNRFARPNDTTRQGNSLETLRSMVASGMGITVVPATAMTGRYAIPLVKRIPFADPIPRRRVVLATRRGFYRPRAISLLAEVIRALPLPITPVAA
ncbi:MAG: LysR family transcriptional regulator [Gammaproteobacteria bacterium]|nr:LysR family transcriptional regulator [Gammaproteobacteria bacterium]